MPTAILPFGHPPIAIELPEGAEILGMAEPKPLADPGRTIRDALRRPIGLPGLDEIVRQKLAVTSAPRVALVVSDNTRPVPYRGEAGILLPIVELLRAEGIPPEGRAWSTSARLRGARRSSSTACIWRRT